MLVAIIYIFIQLIVGFLFCFFGKRLLKPVIMVYGGLLGGLIAFILFTSLAWNIFLVIGLSLVAAILIGFLAYKFFVVGIFFHGAGLGLLLAVTILMLFQSPLTGTLPAIVMVVCAAGLGILTVVFRHALIIIATSINGAYCMVAYGTYLITSFSALASYNGMSLSNTIMTISENAGVLLQMHTLWMLLAIALFAIAGMIIQFKKTAKKGISRK